MCEPSMVLCHLLKTMSGTFVRIVSTENKYSLKLQGELDFDLAAGRLLCGPFKHIGFCLNDVPAGNTPHKFCI